MNPLLDFAGLPRFDEIKPEHVAPAVDELLAAGRAAVAAAVHARPTWDEFVAPLEDANERLGRAWGQVAHLHAVMDNPALREAYNAALPKISQYLTVFMVSVNTQILCDASFLSQSGQSSCMVHTIFGHMPVRCPLATTYGE